MKNFNVYLIIFLTSILFLSCSFFDNAPQIIWLSISDGQRILDAESLNEIEISFSKSMNCYITETNIIISGYYGKVYYQWENHDKTVRIILVDPLEKGNKYTLKIGRGCECAEGFDLGYDLSVDFFTYGSDEDFCVVSTTPIDGDSIETLDGFEIEIEFSLPVDYTTIYDKVIINPELTYNYSFSEDRKILSLSILEHMDVGEAYNVTIKEELAAFSGRSLCKEYTFSFNTLINTEMFFIREAVMSNEGKDIPVSFENYLDRTEGIEKDMKLEVHFSSDLPLYTNRNLINIDPPIPYQLEEPEFGELHFVFENFMELEETYRIIFDESIKNIYGISLDREYCFEWIVNGHNSRLIRPEIIRIKNPMWNPEYPDQFPHTEIYRNGTIYHNENMLMETVIEETDTYNKIQFDILFASYLSATIDLYRSLNKIFLTYMYGNTNAESGELSGYYYNSSENILSLVYSLPYLDSGGDAYYKFIIKGGESGIVDNIGNYMKEDIEIYVKYMLVE